MRLMEKICRNMIKGAMVALMCLLGLSAVAQDVADLKPLQFMGIPIDRSLDKTLKLLKDNGFKSIDGTHYFKIAGYLLSDILLQGEDSKYGKCNVFIKPSHWANDELSCVVVEFTRNDWEGLLDTYKMMKTDFATNFVFEVENGAIQDKSKYANWALVKKGDCFIRSKFNASNGSIGLSISKIGHVIPKNANPSVVVAFQMQSEEDEDSKHLKIKGMTINGSVQVFVQKMKNAGFSDKGEKDNVHRMEGVFAGFKDCELDVYSSYEQNFVYSVKVKFPLAQTWNELVSTYDIIKESLIEKYGEPDKLVEKDYPKVDKTEPMQKVVFVASESDKEEDDKNEEFEYYSWFDTELGTIKLEINVLEKTKIYSQEILNLKSSVAESNFYCYVSLTYTDAANSQRRKTAITNDL